MGIFTKLTPFQLALVLMLLVAVPFLIAMVTVYIVYGVTASKSERCEALCCYAKMKMRKYEPTTDFLEFINNTDHPDYYDVLGERTTIDDNLIKKEKEADEVLETKFLDWAHSVGAILAKSTADTPDQEYVYKCPGALITSSWMLAMGQCVHEGVHAVRIGSKYWSKDGHLAKITNDVDSGEVPLPTMALVKFDPVPPSAINIVESDKAKLVQILTWKENKMAFRLLERQQDITMKTVNLTFEKSIDCAPYEETYQNISCFASKPMPEPLDTFVGVMINNYGKLIGFHLKTICEKNKKFCVVIYLKASGYKEWVEGIVNSNN